LRGCRSFAPELVELAVDVPEFFGELLPVCEEDIDAVEKPAPRRAGIANVTAFNGASFVQQPTAICGFHLLNKPPA